MRNSDTAVAKDVNERALIRRACERSRQSQIADHYHDLARSIREDRLHEAAELQASLETDVARFACVLDESTWARSARTERELLKRYLSLLDAAQHESNRLAREFARLARDAGRYATGKGGKTRVLLIAGGPIREYQFLLNQLNRNPEFVVDVLLQTAALGSEQDCHVLLDHFPLSIDELAKYHVVVAIDPDWATIDAFNDPVKSITLLEHWVAQKAGGLVLIAGPVNTVSTFVDLRLSKVCKLYPLQIPINAVESPTMSIHEKPYIPPPFREQPNTELPGVIEFTNEKPGQELFRLGDSAAANRSAWGAFPGIYDCLPLRVKKPGATVYAGFRQPGVMRGEALPIFAAGQSYGGGQVLYLGSGELWRLRALDQSYFGQIYKRLLDFVIRGGAEPDARPTTFQTALRSTLSLCDACYLALKPIVFGSLAVIDRTIVEAGRHAAERLVDLDRFFATTERLQRLITAHKALGGEIKQRQKQELLLDEN